MSNFKKTDETNEAGANLWECQSCGLEIWSTKQRVSCNCKHLRGLGDAIHNALGAIGIRPKRRCDCPKRRAWLNGVVPFRKKRKKR